MAPWRDKAHRLIGELCRQSYLRANEKPDGTMRRQHMPYSVPVLAQALIGCLNSDNEAGCKEIFAVYHNPE